MLNTVRAKLYALVALGVISTLATLLAMGWTIDTQMTALVADRLAPAVSAIEYELSDRLADADAAARTMAADRGVERSLASGDPADALPVVAPFHDNYPELDFVIARADGTILVELGCDAPLIRLDEIPDLPVVTPGSVSGRGVSSDGCEVGNDAAAPAAVLIHPLPQGGSVVVFMPLNRAVVMGVRERVGVEIAVLDTDTAGINAGTDGFPEEILFGAWGGEDAIAPDAAGHSWAAARINPEGILAEGAAITIVAALDVTEVRTVVMRTVTVAIVSALVLALVSFLLGSRLARTMATALGRVVAGMRRLETADYAHVNDVKTGDEIEALASGFNQMVDGLKERDKLKTTLGKYMTAQVVEHLMAGKIELGGETLEVTILFSDIRSFTSLSEAMDAHALVELLNEYFTEMVSIIIDEGGVVDKYIGDAIMAVFGAPVPKPDDAVRAVRAAVRMRKALTVLNTRLEKRGVEPIHTGIGLHTGRVVAGNIGSEARMEYTVIGDAVNLASRLESATKEVGVDLLISSATYDVVRDEFVCKEVGEMKVKGREAPVTTYTVESIRAKADVTAGRAGA